MSDDKANPVIRGKKKRNFDSFSTFGYRMIKAQDGTLHVSRQTMQIIDNMGHKFIERMMKKCVALVNARKRRGKNKKSRPLITSEICSLAAYILIPEVITGEFATYQPVDSFRIALRNEGKKGVNLWREYSEKIKSNNDKEEKKELFSKYSKLAFPLGRVGRMMKRHCPSYFAISPEAKVFFAFALQYFYSEIIEMTCEKTKNSNISTITPPHLNMAIREDRPVSSYFTGDSLVGGHVMPGIHAARLVPDVAAAN